MIRPDTTKYRLLEMIGMCGEFPADQLNRLIPSASYAEKLITDLKAEHLIRNEFFRMLSEATVLQKLRKRCCYLSRRYASSAI